MSQTIPFQSFGVMLDNSRNAVMKPCQIKKMIDCMCKMGYNTLMLYTEDTYEVDGHPYFGHLRGRYSQQELKDINDYAAAKGIDLIPCIQTLAHLNAIMRWPQYKEMSDCDDILCIGDDRVYELIDAMFASLNKCITSRTINIGMDEAYMVGRGKVMDQRGNCDRTQLFLEHIRRVADIAKKYEFTLCIWSDMFFRLATGTHYGDGELEPAVKAMIPENIRLIYWDYERQEQAHFTSLIQRHRTISDDLWFASGAWTWTGFAPHISYAIEAIESSIAACRENNVSRYFVTVWGDDGAECSRFCILPTLFCAAEFAKGNFDLSDIKQKFYEVFGFDYDTMMLLELPDTANMNGVCDPDKYMLYSDCFMGPWDCTVRDFDAEQYAACAQKLAQVPASHPFSYLFQSQRALCEVLAVKFDIGLQTRRAYQSGDREQIRQLLPRYDELLARLEAFYEAFRNQWFTENKPHGFDVQDIRLGGLIRRVSHCRRRLADYADGAAERIEELEIPLLEMFGRGTDYTSVPVVKNEWKIIATANVL